MIMTYLTFCRSSSGNRSTDDPLPSSPAITVPAKDRTKRAADKRYCVFRRLGRFMRVLTLYKKRQAKVDGYYVTFLSFLRKALGPPGLRGGHTMQTLLSERSEGQKRARRCS